ncbi:Rz1-like lysis system protein LysC [Kocuria sp. CPCC 205274]
MILLVGCVSKSIQYVPVKPIPISPELLNDCITPALPEPFTYASNVLYTSVLLNVIKNCNEDKEAIRQIELSRSIAKSNPPPIGG